MHRKECVNYIYQLEKLTIFHAPAHSIRIFTLLYQCFSDSFLLYYNACAQFLFRLLF